VIGELIRREAAARGDREGTRERVRTSAEEAVHLVGRLQMAIGVAFAAEAGLVDGAIVPDAGDDFLQDAPRRDMKQHIIGNDGWHICPCRHVR